MFGVWPVDSKGFAFPCWGSPWGLSRFRWSTCGSKLSSDDCLGFTRGSVEFIRLPISWYSTPSWKISCKHRRICPTTTQRYDTIMHKNTQHKHTTPMRQYVITMPMSCVKQKRIFQFFIYDFLVGRYVQAVAHMAMVSCPECAKCNLKF